MTVHELIRALVALPPNLPVFVWTPGQYLQPDSVFNHHSAHGAVVLIEGNEVSRAIVDTNAIKTA